MFKPVPKKFDVPALEHEIIAFWNENNIEQKYVHRNDDAAERFSFLDGPITANGLMGVHHAWGRTYKDVWQRYNTMLGKRQRYQNGFDCQGLWVEVTVERELGFTSKRDIESYGIAEFVRKCKESVFNFAAIQTAQSRRLGYFMDWDNSYYTLSDENNYTIWYFLKQCHERGLLYTGPDVMPWCTRCGTGLSEHEIATDGYQDVTHQSVFVRFPLVDHPRTSLLVWTTTPWTLTSNVAVAVNPTLPYLRVQQGEDQFWIAEGSVGALSGAHTVQERVFGDRLLGLHYLGAFDDLPAAGGAEHVVIPWSDVAADEGTGLVHIAPGCGKEDFALGKEHNLKVIAPIDQYGVYSDDFGWLTGKNVQDVASAIVEDLAERGYLYRPLAYTHRYPTCWRCGTELVFRLVDEWFISMEPLRGPMMDVVRSITWIPDYGLEREIDWLRNMGDWMISKKRYWGLALPFWICPNGHVQVIGGPDELRERAVSGLDRLESPHRPWIDAVRLACGECGEEATRIAEVGNPWLDAGIVPFATTHYRTDPNYWRQWFPVNFITESFPGQFRNWFYSLLAMSTVLEDTRPFETVLGYALMKDENGREMHKSWGNLIPFDEAADKAGADMMRWLFCQHNPDTNINFGWGPLDDVKRRLLVLWNTYSFFITYATLDEWTPAGAAAPPVAERAVLDRWVLARLHVLIQEIREGLDRYDASGPARATDRFIEELSTWYVRRSRRRFWKSESDADKLSAYATLYECLTTLSRLIAPFMPHVAEVLYQNLVRSVDSTAPESVHLEDFPQTNSTLIDRDLLVAMDGAQQVVALGRAARDRSGIKVRQPLARIHVQTPRKDDHDKIRGLQDVILDELNVKELVFAGPDDAFVSYTIRPNLPVLGPRLGKRIPEVRKGLEDLDAEDVARLVSEGRTVDVSTRGELVQLAANEVLVTAQERPGYAAQAGGGYLVALDVSLSPELIQEGFARDIIRHLNNWRKEAGLSIDDRIVVRFRASPGLDSAIHGLHAYISEETLCVSLEPAKELPEGFAGTAHIGQELLEIALQRA